MSKNVLIVYIERLIEKFGEQATVQEVIKKLRK